MEELEITTDTPPQETPAAPTVKRKKILLILVPLLVLLLAGGGVACWVFFLKGGGAATPATGEKKSEEVPQQGSIFVLEPFIVNLMDLKGIRFLKLTLEVELAGIPEDVFKKETPKIRDSLIILLTSKGYEEVSSIQGKLKLREEILYRVNKIVGDGKVKAVYFTDFVVQ
jgi:flagellar FliL protein